jgi:hypothetical protein
MPEVLYSMLAGEYNNGCERVTRQPQTGTVNKIDINLNGFVPVNPYPIDDSYYQTYREHCIKANPLQISECASDVFDDAIICFKPNVVNVGNMEMSTSIEQGLHIIDFDTTQILASKKHNYAGRITIGSGFPNNNIVSINLGNHLLGAGHREKYFFFIQELSRIAYLMT